MGVNEYIILMGCSSTQTNRVATLIQNSPCRGSSGVMALKSAVKLKGEIILLILSYQLMCRSSKSIEVFTSFFHWITPF